MTKELRKAIMNRSKLKNKSNSVNTRDAYHEYKKQRNLCTYLLKKAKKDYYSNLNPKTITDNKKFWKTVKPLLSDKSIAKETITLVENDEIFQNEQLLAEKFNEFFSTAVTKLKIRINSNIIIRNIVDTDPISRAIAKYSAHPSIIKIN